MPGNSLNGWGPSARQFANSCFDLGAIESHRAVPGKRQRPAVVLERQLALAEVIQADREVVGVVRILRIGRKGPEISRLGIRPASLGGVLVAEREVEERRVRLLREDVLDAALGLQRIGLARAAR